MERIYSFVCGIFLSDKLNNRIESCYCEMNTDEKSILINFLNQISDNLEKNE